ncbi:MAG: putative 4-hydroxybenzoate polyprenyltransferase [Planctomycetes bacterium]|nr:putative 4-hydroxybenzoate polyprenyltransferase [Planctomycetota bacterium]MCC7061247.1 UbiA family prenyltransferase [Planctomycetota bacterium]
MTAGTTPGVREFASLVKLSHSVFALPFALLSLLCATAGAPSFSLLALVVLAVVAARTAAMAYNRVVDREIDAKNPRTAGREIPRGVVRPAAALLLVAAAGAIFLLACWLLAPICFWLGLPTLAWLLLYSHLKRFSALCHWWLGIALGISPVAAWLAADGAFSVRTWAPAVLGMGVAFWVAGFDILYSCQDEEFDRANGLHSIPARFGARGAMWVSRALHLLALGCFAWFGAMVPLGFVYQAGVVLSAGLMVWQHRLLRPDDLSRIQTAFFTANGTIAIGMFAAGCIDLYLFALPR